MERRNKKEKGYLTKILNAVDWGVEKSEKEFLDNIMNKWSDDCIDIFVEKR
mgnify:CR=1 FL=1